MRETSRPILERALEVVCAMYEVEHDLRGDAAASSRRALTATRGSRPTLTGSPTSACADLGLTWAGVSACRVRPARSARLAGFTTRSPGEDAHLWLDRTHDRPACTDGCSDSIGPAARRSATLHALACVEPPSGGRRRSLETFEDHRRVRGCGRHSTRRPSGGPVSCRTARGVQARDAGVRHVPRARRRPSGGCRSLDYSDRGVPDRRAVAEGRAPWRLPCARARWDDAVARGTPALVTEAKPDTSYPILKRVGFVDVCTIRRLEDVR